MVDPWSIEYSIGQIRVFLSKYHFLINYLAYQINRFSVFYFFNTASVAVSKKIIRSIGGSGATYGISV